MEILKKDCSSENLISLKKWFESEASNDDIKDFMIYEGGYVLFNLLRESEFKSRKTFNFKKQIIILEIIDYLLTKSKSFDFDIMDLILNIKGSFTDITMNINRYNVEVSCIAFEIIIKFFYLKQNAYYLFYDAIINYKNENNLKY